MSPSQFPSFQTSPRSRTAGAARGTWLYLVAFLFALALYLAAFTVPQGEVAVVARFGDPRRLVEEPGLHFKWPAPVDSVFPVDMRTHVLDPEGAEFLTKDQKNVDVDAFVAWKVDDPQRFLKSLRDRAGAEEKIGQVLQSALNEILKSGAFNELVSLEGSQARSLVDVRADVTGLVAERCNDNGYGVAIKMVGIERITFPDDNKPAVEAAMRTSRQKEARQIAAEGQEVAAKIETDARREQASIRAKAKADAALIRGQGVSAAKGIEAASRSLNPELFDLVSRHEIGLQALRGQTLIVTTDDWLMRIFEDPDREPGAQDPKDGGDDSQ